MKAQQTVRARTLGLLAGSAALVGCLVLTACGTDDGVTSPSAAATPSPAAPAIPGSVGIDGVRYEVATFTTTVPALVADDPPDPADVYHPSVPRPSGQGFPVALMLQGGLVERSAYNDYARQVASYGFVVVVPDHERLLFGQTALYAEQTQVRDVAAWMESENVRSASPVAGRVDPSTLVLMGHSFGGATALSAVEGICRLPFCIVAERDYPERPPQVKAASLYGTNLSSPTGDEVPFVNTQGVPVAFIQGSVDTATTPEETNQTYARMSGGTKAIVTIEGAGHFGLVDADAETAPGGGSPAQPLAQASSIETAGRWTALTLLAFLGDPAATAYVTTTGDAADPLAIVTAFDSAP
jgi:predicted dienelactone hydrolase